MTRIFWLFSLILLASCAVVPDGPERTGEAVEDLSWCCYGVEQVTADEIVWCGAADDEAQAAGMAVVAWFNDLVAFEPDQVSCELRPRVVVAQPPTGPGDGSWSWPDAPDVGVNFASEYNWECQGYGVSAWAPFPGFVTTLVFYCRDAYEASAIDRAEKFWAKKGWRTVPGETKCWHDPNTNPPLN